MLTCVFKTCKPTKFSDFHTLQTEDPTRARGTQTVERNRVRQSTGYHRGAKQTHAETAVEGVG